MKILTLYQKVTATTMLHLFSSMWWVIAHQVLLFVFRKGEVQPEALLMFSRVTNLMQTEGETSNNLACMVTLVVVMLLIHARRIRCLFLVFLCSCGHLFSMKGFDLQIHVLHSCWVSNSPTGELHRLGFSENLCFSSQLSIQNLR